MKIYALWVPIMTQMVKHAELEKDKSITFFSPAMISGRSYAYCARAEESLTISVLADITCECGEKYFLTVSSRKPLRKGDYIIAWSPEIDKNAFKEFARLSVIVGENLCNDKVLDIFDAKVKFNNFTISGGCDCREMSEMEKLMGGRKL